MRVIQPSNKTNLAKEMLILAKKKVMCPFHSQNLIAIRLESTIKILTSPAKSVFNEEADLTRK